MEISGSRSSRASNFEGNKTDAWALRMNGLLEIISPSNLRSGGACVFSREHKGTCSALRCDHHTTHSSPRPTHHNPNRTVPGKARDAVERRTAQAGVRGYRQDVHSRPSPTHTTSSGIHAPPMPRASASDWHIALPPLCRSLPILLRINTNRSPVCSAGLLPTCDPYQASRGLPASGASWTQCLRSPVARHYNRPSELGKLQPLPSPCALGLSSTEARRPTTNRYLQTGRCRRRSR